MAKYEKEMETYRPKLQALQSQVLNLKSEIDATMPRWAIDLQQIIDSLSLRHISSKEDSLDRAQKAWDLADPRFVAIQKDLTDLLSTAPRAPIILVRVLSQRNKNLRPTHLMIRGDFLRPDQPVTPATLSILHPLNSKTPTRLDLAKWLMDDANPLTARVFVNDLWLHLFGQALVRTPNDFGVRGEKPTHPELLDYLAT